MKKSLFSGKMLQILQKLSSPLDNSDLFICKRVCYIISRAADNLQEVKQEIEEAFKAREKPRAKRLLRSEDGKPDEALLLVSPGNP